MKTPAKKLTTTCMAILAMLIFTTTGVAAGDKAKGSKPDWSQQWYIRLIIVSLDDTTMRDEGNVLGHLDDSVAGYDGHDLFELDPIKDGYQYLTLVFPHPDWEEPGTYSSDYHATNAEDPDEWVFEVLSDYSYRNILLYWNPLIIVERDGEPHPGEHGWSMSPQLDTAEELIGRMWLEDTLTGERIPAIDSGQLQNYGFNMEGSTSRSFRWIMEDRYGRKAKPAKVKVAKANRLNKANKVKDPIEGLPPAVSKGE